MLDLHQHVGSKQRVRLVRSRPANPLLNGYLLAMENGLILMHPFDGFKPDGYAIIRAADVAGARSDAHERFWDTMLSAESLLGGLNALPALKNSHSTWARIRVCAHLALITQ